MARRSNEGWKTSWGNWVEGKSTQQRRMEEDPENGKESSHSARASERKNERMKFSGQLSGYQIQAIKLYCTIMHYSLA